MQVLRHRRGAAAVLVVSAGLTLAACGTPSPATRSTTGPSQVVGTTPSLDARTLNGIDAQLGTVDSDLSQANIDIDSPKADS